LILRDVGRIAAYLGISIDKLKSKLWASPGSLVKHFPSQRVERIGTITPRWNRHTKACVFLTDDDKCSIHPVAPFGCAYYDTHMDWLSTQIRSQWCVNEHQDPAYQALRDTLPYATHYKPFETNI